jgi:hypothetical protein
VREYGGRDQAESVLQAREHRVERLHLRPLASEDREHFLRSWRSVESRFVDDPAGATVEAEDLLGEVMKARGYPDADFEERVGDISATYPRLVDEYRTAHETAASSRRGDGKTEELRRALVAYRSLFEGLLETRDTERREAA